MSDKTEAPKPPESSGGDKKATPDTRGSDLSPEQRTRVQEWYKAKVQNQKAPGCSLCGTHEWSLLNDIVTPTVYTGGSLQIGGTSYPHFMLICENCGNVQFINAVRTGVLDGKPK